MFGSINILSGRLIKFMETIDLSTNKYQINMGKNKNIHRKYEITFNTSSEKVYNKDNDSYLIPFIENEIVRLKTSAEGEISCFVSYKDYGRDKGDIFFSKKIKDRISESTNLVSIESMPQIKFRTPRLASVDNVKSSNVVIYSKNKIIDIDDPKIIGINIVNNLNGASIYVEKKNIIYQYDKEEDAIHLNHEHRMMLDLELPGFINQYYLDIIKKDNKDDDFNKYYVDETQNVCYSCEEDYVAVKKYIGKVLCNHNIFQLSVYPVYKVAEVKRNIINRISYSYLKGLIRTKTKKKTVIRPYSIDESDKIVRLTTNSLKQIGADENDFIVLKNPISKNILKVKAMAMDDETAIFQENRIRSSQYLNLCIGIPLHIRNELELESLNSTVEIERDLGFIFKKHLNSQIQSLIGVLLSFIAIKDYVNNGIIVAMISIVLLVILIYISFSDIRERIDE